ncbi:unnamed protein product [Darwinula stevensoni]|uniref:NR LBD domain-containing protein n=1 Tax=Darwinula stevensoni TaxID=69355 RepID=A0A7R9A8A1_9CRUS|nr:unnamed protein product [Darwinula stevensoni]CAG0896225.1 unnamed protein product [Darwinula stevensoni]
MCVVPEYQCAVKREAKKAQKDKDRPNSTTSCSPEGPPPPSEKVPSFNRPPALPRDGSACLMLDGNGLVRRLSPEQEELINRLVYFQEEFEQPSEDDIKKITNFAFESDDQESRFKHITEMTILTVQLIVEFSKRLPGFDTLQREDQITLLKVNSKVDIYSLRFVEPSSVDFTTSPPAERPSLLEPKKVEKIQEIYLEALRSYLESKRPRPGLTFAKLLTILPELRTLGNLNSELCFSLKLKNKKLPAFLAEIWDI